MTKFLLAAALLLLSFTASAAAPTSDLNLPGERWIAGFNSYICDAFKPSVVRPEAYETLNVNFEKISTDITLDNVLLIATFQEEGRLCRYSALLLADNAAFTAKLMSSQAFAPANDSQCLAGKALLDQQLAQFPYLYYGHPHHLALVLPFTDAEKICGAGTSTVAVDFVLKAKVQ